MKANPTIENNRTKSLARIAPPLASARSVLRRSMRHETRRVVFGKNPRSAIPVFAGSRRRSRPRCENRRRGPYFFTFYRTNAGDTGDWKGGHDALHSRRMSRGRAKREFSVEDLARQTEGVECRKDQAVLDESPGAYKDIDQVMDYQRDLVEVVAQLKQVMCVKG
jgi:hypothetical protein